MNKLIGNVMDRGSTFPVDKESYLLYAEGQGAPSVIINSEEAAEAEAERLSSIIGVPVYIFKCVTKVASKVAYTTVKTDV